MNVFMLMIYLLLFAILFSVMTFICLRINFERSGERTEVIKAPIREVYNTVMNFEGQKNWRSDIKDVKILSSTSWVEYPESGPAIQFQSEEAKESTYLRISWKVLSDGPISLTGYWIGRFEAIENSKATKVVFKESAKFKGLLFRILSMFFFDLKNHIRLYQTDLKDYLEKGK